MNNTILGLDKEKTKEESQELNILLANFQVFYQTLRGLHWNIKGKNFFELHAKFEELYLDAQEKIDLIAERVLTLQGTPMHTFKDYTMNATVEVGENVFKDEEAVALIVRSLSELLKIERGILELSDEIGDEGTNSMMSDFIAEQEKTIWMFNAWLN
ncbi:Dps family protein [Tenacibaculum sp. M341]|uniref:Dps family protein n=1 Tax=Tenacibaculum sp. M341 TaxID=2530339 RepID=UPI00104D9AE1|nr:Dps family protein [Tenacibaculum sp. M341]TCI85424.1 DNA starvation/stationary phase protection protein [Tenacibaculum sp. M341]